MKLEEGVVFTGKWFTGKVLVNEILEETNELKVRLQSKVDATEDDYWWFETWNLEHTRLGIDNGDYFLTPEARAGMIALKRHERGDKHSVSTFIDEDTIIAGYGKLDIDFEYPLPVKTILEIYGTTSWRQWFINEGFFKYECTCKTTGEMSITPYYKDEDMIEVKKENPNYKFKKIEQ